MGPVRLADTERAWHYSSVNLFADSSDQLIGHDRPREAEMLPTIGFMAAAIVALHVVPNASISEPNDIVLVAEKKKTETKTENKMGGGVQGAILANKETPEKTRAKKTPTIKTLCIPPGGGTPKPC